MKRKINCEKCRGGGAVECPQCKGEGHDRSGKKCSHCMGAGLIICNKCGGSGEVEVEVKDIWANMGW